MEDQARQEMKPIEKAVSFLDAVKAETLPAMHAGQLRENHINRVLDKDEVPESDNRRERKYARYFDLRQIDIKRATDGKNPMEALAILKECLLCEMQENTAKMGFKIDRVESEWNKKRPWLELFDATIVKLSAKVR
jgi:hypothetical protein